MGVFYKEVSPRQMKNRDPWLYWAVSRGIGKSKKNWMPIFKHFILISPIYRVTMYTTVVPDSLGGRGVAKLLADEAFDFAVKEQVLLKPCWVIWIDHHDHMQIFKPSWCYQAWYKRFVQVGLKLTCWYLSGYLKRHPRVDVSQLLLDWPSLWREYAFNLW